jgi:3-deoxy-D-manno-octulosonic acid kinase
MITARGAMLYDASCIGQPSEAVFDAAYWLARKALEQAAGGRGTVAFVREGERRWVLRHYRRGGFVARFLDDAYLWAGAERTRSFAEWRLLRRLRDWGLPVPRPVAARYARSGLVYRADLLTEELPTRTTLAMALAARSLDGDSWRAVGRCIASLHARGVHHADLNAHNLLLATDGAVFVLDFDRGRVRARGPWETAVLERLRRSLAKVTAGLPAGRFDAAAWQSLMQGYAEA